MARTSGIRLRQAADQPVPQAAGRPMILAAAPRGCLSTGEAELIIFTLGDIFNWLAVGDCDFCITPLLCREEDK